MPEPSENEVTWLYVTSFVNGYYPYLQISLTDGYGMAWYGYGTLPYFIIIIAVFYASRVVHD